MLIREIQVKNVITKSNLPICDYSVNPYTGCEHACKYCYACFMKRFTGHEENWGEFVDVKFWQPIKNAKKFEGKEFFIGSVTDPYQPSEEKYGRTRALLEQLKDSGASISVATKSDLILRDLELIRSFPSAQVSWSVNTLDEAFKNDMDNAVSIERRLAAMKAFHDAGVRTACFVSPIFPEITDVKAIIEKSKDKCHSIWLENLNLRGTFKPTVIGYIERTHPELLPLYKDIYSYGNDAYWRTLDAELREYVERLGLEYVVNEDTISRPIDLPPVVVNYFYHSKIKKSARKEGAD